MLRTAAAALALAACMVGRVSTQDTGQIVSEAVIEAAPEAVWTAWTTSAGLRGWLAPHVEIDLQLGGLMRTNHNPQGKLGDPQTIENTILSFEPGNMLSTRVAAFPRDFPFPKAVGDMWTVVYFDAAGEGRTRVRVVGLGFGPDDESQRMRAFFERGNAATLEQLRRYFSGTSR